MKSKTKSNISNHFDNNVVEKALVNIVMLVKGILDQAVNSLIHEWSINKAFLHLKLV